MRTLGLTLIATLAAACSFDRSGLGPTDDPDAHTIDGGPPDGPLADGGPDAPPGTPDAMPDGPVDPIDAAPDACVANPLGELCNGADDTCDGVIDEGFDLITPCDGADSDFCADDTPVCEAGGLGTTCTTGDDDVETCNGMDDDCDGNDDEGFGVGDDCDGADTDLCQEGTFVCGGGVAVCNDATSSTTETCNGADDDCDGTDDEDFPTLGDPCDGTDGDMCSEGVFTCDGGGGVMCSDMSVTNTESCNMMDDDCDGMSDEGFDLTTDEANCGSCGTACTNAFGTNTCLASTCTPVCIGAGAMNCDGNPNNGCEIRNTNPTCSPDAIDLGDVTGDDNTTVPPPFPFVATASGYTEAWYLVTINETVSGGGGDTEAEIALEVPPNVDFDLYVYCLSCATASPIDSSTGNSGVDESVAVRRGDAVGSQTFDVLIEIRHFPIAGEACGNWNLTVTGSTDVGGAGTCP
jgi:hypothetical protein